MKEIEKPSFFYRFSGICLVILIVSGCFALIRKIERSTNTLTYSGAAETNTVNKNSKDGKVVSRSNRTKKINVNKASEAELEILPGIGSVKARAIVEYRKKYGQFKSKEDIIKVKGIGVKTFEQIKDMIEI